MTWTQSDPLYRFAADAGRQPRRALLYTNDLNNPLRYSDPDGRLPGASDLIHPDAETIAQVHALVDPMFEAAVESSSEGGVGEARAAALVLVAAGIAVVGTAIACVVPDTYPVTPHDLGAGRGSFDPQPVYANGDPVYANGDPSPGSSAPVPESAPDEKTDKVEPIPWPDDEKTDKVKPLPWPPAQPSLPPARVIPKKKRLPPGSSSASASSQKSLKPADLNHDGKVTNEEESEWMRSIQ